MPLFTDIFKRSLENPSTPLSAPDDWLFDALGSFRASSGVNVNRETALTYDCYWRCINLISGDLAKLPLCVYKLSADGQTKQKDYDHPAYDILLHEADPDISALDFKRTLTMHCMAEGNGYAFIQRDRGGRPIQLWPLSPMKTYPVRKGQQIWYITEAGVGEERRIEADDIFHLKGISFDGLVGYSTVAKMREALGLGLAAENFGNIFFRNNARPNVVLRHPGKLKPEAKQNLRESWERLHSGLENAHRTAVLEEGMDITAFMHNARDSQLIELRQFSRIQICNFFGVPPHKVGDDSRTAYNSLEQENSEYLIDGGGLGFWIAAWEAESRRKLLTVPQKLRNTHCIQFEKNQLLRANLQTRTAYYVAMLQNGVLCPDEVRSDEGLNPRPDGKGGEFQQSANTLKPGDVGDKPAADDQADKDKPDDSGIRHYPPFLVAKDGCDGRPGTNGQRGTDGSPGREGKPGKDGRDGRDGRDGKDADPKKVVEIAMEAINRRRLPTLNGLIYHAAGRMCDRIGNAAKQAATEPKKFLTFCNSIEADHLHIVRQQFAPVLATVEQPPSMADKFTKSLAADLLDLSGRATAKTLADEVGSLCHYWQVVTVPLLADALVEGRAIDEPSRTVAEALAILEQIPERRPGFILPTFPVNMVPPFVLTAEKLRGLWEEDKVYTKTQKLRELISCQDWINKDHLRKAIKEDVDWTEETLNVEGSPTDYPYIIESGSLCYIYDGDHRLTAKFLLGVSKTKVYYVQEGDL